MKSSKTDATKIDATTKTLHTTVFFMAIFTNWLAKKGEPVSGFG